MHFAYGPVFAISAYSAWAAGSLLGLPLWASVLVAPPTAALAGAAVYWLAYRPFELRGMSMHSIFILSLAPSIRLESVLNLVFGPSIHPFRDYAAPIFIFGPIFVTGLQIGQGVALVAVVIALVLFLRQTRYGKAILALADHRDMARIVGIDTDRVSLLVFM